MTPQLLKSGVTDALLDLMKPIQDEFRESTEWQDIEKKAYPPPEVKKKEKKVKDKGSRHPGAAVAKAADGAGKDQGEGASGAAEAVQKLDIKSGTTS